jgi:hypothetical protein
MVELLKGLVVLPRGLVPMRWEYKAFKFKAEGFWQGGKIDHGKLENTLNLLGHDGWELVSITAAQARGWTEDIVAVLKRPRPAENR